MKIDELASQYKYLEGLPIEAYQNVSPRILIGIDNCRLCCIVVKDERMNLTRLGWLVYGPCSSATGSVNENYSAYHSFHICLCSEQPDTELHRTVQDYFTLENVGAMKPQRPAVEGRRSCNATAEFKNEAKREPL